MSQRAFSERVGTITILKQQRFARITLSEIPLTARAKTPFSKNSHCLNGDKKTMRSQKIVMISGHYSSASKDCD